MKLLLEPASRQPRTIVSISTSKSVAIFPSKLLKYQTHDLVENYLCYVTEEFLQVLYNINTGCWRVVDYARRSRGSWAWSRPCFRRCRPSGCWRVVDYARKSRGSWAQRCWPSGCRSLYYFSSNTEIDQALRLSKTECFGLLFQLHLHVEVL
jgi:hypothetical protein